MSKEYDDQIRQQEAYDRAYEIEAQKMAGRDKRKAREAAREEPIPEVDLSETPLKHSSERGPTYHELISPARYKRLSTKEINDRINDRNTSNEDLLRAYQDRQAKKDQSVGTKINHRMSKLLNNASKSWNNAKENTKERTQKLWRKIKDSNAMLGMREKINQKKLDKAIKDYEQALQKYAMYSKYGEFSNNLGGKIDKHSNKMEKLEQRVNKADKNLNKISNIRQNKSTRGR